MQGQLLKVKDWKQAQAVLYDSTCGFATLGLKLKMRWWNEVDETLMRRGLSSDCGCVADSRMGTSGKADASQVLNRGGNSGQCQAEQGDLRTLT